MTVDKDIKSIIAVSLLAALTSACGGGGGGTTSSTGVLLDAEVQGVSYSASPSGRSGTTNAAGEYQYVSGDTVTFSVGGIILGSAPATGVMTPASLANAIDPATLPSGVTTEDVALNIAIFLQTFDLDGNPDNGITLDSTVAMAATNLVLDFQQDSVDFSSDATLTQLATDLSDESVTYEVVSAADAEQHLEETLLTRLEGSWLMDGNDTPSSLTVLTFFPDGTYVLGINHEDPNCGDGVEYGKYHVDATAMRLYVSEVMVDNTGNPEFGIQDCGLYEIEEDSSVTIRDSGVPIQFNSLTQFSFIDPDDVENDNEENGTLIGLTKITNNGIHGSWTERDLASGEIVGMPTFLPNGTYMVAQIDAHIDIDPEAGVEVGTYLVGAENALTVSSIATDTNGSAGLSDIFECAESCPTIVLNTDSYGRLTIGELGAEPLIMTSNPYRLFLAGNSASSRAALVWSECPNDPAGWDYAFTADNMVWTGSDSWDGTPSCVVEADDTIDFKAELSEEGGVPGVDSSIDSGYYGSSFDAPFAGCLGGICDYHELNKILSGTDDSGRPFTSTYEHTPGSNLLIYVKEITDGADLGQTISETITLD